jgi:large subunit ribosomal protein L31
MKDGIHPEMTLATVSCSNCGATFETHATRASITVEVCSQCHPAYTGVERAVSRGSRIERFERRRRRQTAPSSVPTHRPVIADGRAGKARAS